jgi:hypothetical protein
MINLVGGPYNFIGGITDIPGSPGKVYYVDGNDGVDTQDGLSWETAVKTLAVAFALSNADIASGAFGWTSRNRIYVKSDNAEADAETIETLPSKCDVIGVGSYDHRPCPMFIGNHVIGDGAYMGTRFINMGFLSPAAGGVIFTVPTTTSGLAFINCMFDGRSTTAATKAILATAVEQFTVQGCRFIGKFSTTTIDLGTGATRALLIKDNLIESGAIGITTHASLTCADAVGMIINNVFDVVTLFIDENSDKLIIGGNRGRTQADGTAILTLDYNAAMAYDNVFTHSAGTSLYPALVAIPT